MLFPIHGYPQDYWRFTPEGFTSLLSPFDDAWVTGVGHPMLPTQIIGLGAKGRPLQVSETRFATLAAAQEEYERADGKVRLGVLNVSLRDLTRAVTRDFPRAITQRARARVTRRA